MEPGGSATRFEELASLCRFAIRGREHTEETSSTVTHSQPNFHPITAPLSCSCEHKKNISSNVHWAVYYAPCALLYCTVNFSLSHVMRCYWLSRSRIHERTNSLRFLVNHLRSSQTWGFRIQCLHYKPVSIHFCSSKSVSRGDSE